MFKVLKQKCLQCPSLHKNRTNTICISMMELTKTELNESPDVVFLKIGLITVKSL